MDSRKKEVPSVDNDSVELAAFQAMGRDADYMKMHLMRQAPSREKMRKWMSQAADDAYLEGKTIRLADTLKIPLPSVHLRGGAVHLANRELLWLFDAIVSKAMELSARVSQQPHTGCVGFPLKS